MAFPERQFVAVLQARIARDLIAKNVEAQVRSLFRSVKLRNAVRTAVLRKKLENLERQLPIRLLEAGRLIKPIFASTLDSTDFGNFFRDPRNTLRKEGNFIRAMKQSVFDPVYNPATRTVSVGFGNIPFLDAATAVEGYSGGFWSLFEFGGVAPSGPDGLGPVSPTSRIGASQSHKFVPIPGFGKQGEGIMVPTDDPTEQHPGIPQVRPIRGTIQKIKSKWFQLIVSAQNKAFSDVQLRGPSV